MSKYQEVTDSLQQKFDSILEKTSIPEFVTFKLLHVESQKHPMKVFKTNDLTKFLTKIEVIIIVNEDMFDKLDDNLQNILIEETLTEVFYNSEKDKIEMIKKDFVTFETIISKYKDEYHRLYESIKSLIDQATQKEKDSKSKK